MGKIKTLVTITESEGDPADHLEASIEYEFLNVLNALVQHTSMGRMEMLGFIEDKVDLVYDAIGEDIDYDNLPF